jgi:hypothetical protein
LGGREEVCLAYSVTKGATYHYIKRRRSMNCGGAELQVTKMDKNTDG